MRWSLAAAAILLVALAAGLGLLAYAMYALVGVIVVSRLAARYWAESLQATRECNRLSARVGDLVAVVVAIRNAGRLPIPWVLAEDVLPRRALAFDPPQLKLTGQREELYFLRGGKGGTLLYQVQCNCRGYYQLGPLILETGDVFGLHRRWRLASEPHFLLVLPQVTPIGGYDIASKRPIGEVRLTHRLFEDPTRTAGIRRYMPGDPLRRVHWRGTARTGVLHSKLYEPSSVAGATILLDFHRAGFDAQHEPVRSELAVTAAASLAHVIYELGQQVGLVTNGRDAADRIRQHGWAGQPRTRRQARAAAGMRETSDRLRPLVVPTRRGAEQFLEILETLARVELTDGLDFGQLVAETTSRLPRDASVIAILARVTPAAAIVLGMLHRRGWAVTAVVNTFATEDFAQIAAPLVAQNVPCRHLASAASLPALCRQLAVRGGGTGS